MSKTKPGFHRLAGAAALTGAVTFGAGAIGVSPASAASNGIPSQEVHVAQFGIHAHPITLKVAEVPSIRAEVPKAILQSGKLIIGVGALPSGTPPLAYIGSDQKSLTGSEPDLGRLVAAVFGLTPQLEDYSFENLFIRMSTQAVNVGFSNITDTQLRKKQGLDFASYRKDQVGFEVLKKNKWNFKGNYENLAGMTVAVGAGTNQQSILVKWQKQLKAQGKTLTIKYFNTANSTYLALDSGRIDAYFTPNPSIAYHVIEDADTPFPTRDAGVESGAGPTIQGLISATTKKGDGLVKPLSDAINVLIKNGDYRKWLAAYGLQTDAVQKSYVNPPGLPLSVTGP